MGGGHGGPQYQGPPNQAPPGYPGGPAVGEKTVGGLSAPPLGEGSGSAVAPGGAAVIHDLGFRRYTGLRVGIGTIAANLIIEGFKASFGFGRSARSKVMPIILIVVMLLVATVLSSIVVYAEDPTEREVINYTQYTGLVYWTGPVIALFAAIAAPVLFSADLRTRSIVLYFSRPLPRSVYVLCRQASLALAIFAILVVPLLIWFLAGIQTGADIDGQLRRGLAALIGIVLMSVGFAAIGGLIASLVTQRGLSVVAVLMSLFMLWGVISTVQGVMISLDHDGVAAFFGLLHPQSAADGFAQWVGGSEQYQPVLVDSAGWGLLSLIGAALWIAVPTWLLQLRYRKAGSL